jgi:glucose-1-phosphate thymidylyltransferase
LYPITKGISKQLLPIYNKPMIYYPLSVLMLAGIRDILIISTQETLPQFKNIFGDGSAYGLRIEYARQDEPRGIAEAFIIGERFIAGDTVSLILGDNIFFGHGLLEEVREAALLKEGALIFAYNVKDPERYGVVEFDKDFNVLSIEEKPSRPRSSWAVTGLYFYDNSIVRVTKGLKPSARGELEITDVNKVYLNDKKLKVMLMGRGHAWLDTGTYDSLIDASMFIKTVEDRQGLKIACIEEIAYNMGYISREQLLGLGRAIKTSYGDYLQKIAEE